MAEAEQPKAERTVAPLLLAVLVVVDIAFVWANYQAFAPCDGHFTLGFVRMLWGISLLCFGLFVMLAVVRNVVLSATGDQSWRPSIEWGILGVSTSIALFGGMAAADAAIDVQLERFTERTEPMLQAIRSYAESSGEPPGALEDLVPAHLDAVPDHGVCASTGYDYRVGKEGEFWMIRLPIDVDAIEPIYLLYRSDEDYTQVPVLRRISTWAYVHD